MVSDVIIYQPLKEHNSDSWTQTTDVVAGTLIITSDFSEQYAGNQKAVCDCGTALICLITSRSGTQSSHGVDL